MPSLVFVAEDNPETIRFMTMLGNLDNAKLHLKPDFRTHVIAMHDRMTQLNIAATEMDAYGAQVRKDMCFSTGIASGLMGQYWALASHKGAVWDCILKIFQGKFDDSRGKTYRNSVPKSVSHFTKLGNMPPKVVVHFLTQVLANEWSFAMMNNKIAEYKTSQRIKSQSAQALHSAGLLGAPPRPLRVGRGTALSQQMKVDLWSKHWNAQVPKKCPALGAQWIATWAVKLAKGKMKDALPEQYLERMLKLWKHSINKTQAALVIEAYFM